MSREELAARIYAVSCYKGDQPCSDSFAQADKFLAYAAKERGKVECDCDEDSICIKCIDKKCDHDCDGYKCNHPSHEFERMKAEIDRKHTVYGGAPKVTEPPKPKRKAREVWIKFSEGGGYISVHYCDDGSGTRIPFREVLPEGDA